MNNIHSTMNKVAEQIENSEVQSQMCFCRWYRKNGNTKYTFYRANITKKIAIEFKKWLITHINYLNDREIENISEYGDGCLPSIDLNNIDTWKYFGENAFNLKCQELTDLKSIKHNLKSYIIYIKYDDILVGYTTRLKPSHVLAKKGMFKLQFDNSTFNQINDNNGVEINNSCSFLFISNRTMNIGLIFNMDDFESIFDMNEQYQIEAENIIRKSDIFQCFGNKDRILEIVKSDRTVQKMLRNPVSQKSFTEININDIGIIKTYLGNDVNFTIDDDNNIRLGENEKEAFKDLIKAVGHHFNKTLFGDHIIESSPKRFLREN